MKSPSEVASEILKSLALPETAAVREWLTERISQVGQAFQDWELEALRFSTIPVGRVFSEASNAKELLEKGWALTNYFGLDGYRGAGEDASLLIPGIPIFSKFGQALESIPLTEEMKAEAALRFRFGGWEEFTRYLAGLSGLSVPKPKVPSLRTQVLLDPEVLPTPVPMGVLRAEFSEFLDRLGATLRRAMPAQAWNLVCVGQLPNGEKLFVAPKANVGGKELPVVEHAGQIYPLNVLADVEGKLVLATLPPALKAAFQEEELQPVPPSLDKPVVAVSQRLSLVDMVVPETRPYGEVPYGFQKFRHGWCGAPVFDWDGNLVGIVYDQLPELHALGYVPWQKIANALAELAQKIQVNSPLLHGEREPGG